LEFQVIVVEMVAQTQEVVVVEQVINSFIQVRVVAEL
jgi:hypothetical protein